AARVRISQAVKPPALERLERRLAALAREREALMRDASHGHGIAPDRLAAIEAECRGLQDDHDCLAAAWHAEQAAALQVLEARARLQDAAADVAVQDRVDPSSDAVMTASAALRKLRGESPMVFTEVDR